MRQRPTGWLGFGQWTGNSPPAGCVNISPHHLGSAQNHTFQGKPGSKLSGYTLQLGASMLICGNGAYPGVQPETVEQTSTQQITLSLSAPYTIHQLNWCWYRCSNSWLATKKVLTISFGYLFSHARRRYFEPIKVVETTWANIIRKGQLLSKMSNIFPPKSGN